MVWRYEARDGRWTKVPYDAQSGRKASSIDPDTWSSFAAALARYQAQRDRWAGIGLVFSEAGKLCGVDLDHSRDSVTGEILPWAQPLVELLDSYTEVSPSGTGLKIFLEAKPPIADGQGMKKVYGEGVVEVYGRGRYFTVTGHLVGRPWPWTTGKAS